MLEEFMRRVSTWALKLTKDEELAGEVAQETMYRMLLKGMELNAENLPYAFITCRNLYFKQKKRDSRFISITTLDTSCELPLGESWEIPENTTPRQKHAITLLIEGYKLDEIAKEMSCDKDEIKLLIKYGGQKDNRRNEGADKLRHGQPQ